MRFNILMESSRQLVWHARSAIYELSVTPRSSSLPRRKEILISCLFGGKSIRRFKNNQRVSFVSVFLIAIAPTAVAASRRDMVMTSLCWLEIDPRFPYNIVFKWILEDLSALTLSYFSTFRAASCAVSAHPKELREGK